MKRSIDSTNIDELISEDAPHIKVTLVERDHQPNGIQLVDPQAVAKRSVSDAMELCESVSTAETFIHANARNKLDVIGRQMGHLHNLMKDVFEEARVNSELHKVACNFIKKPGHVYHLYQRPSGQQYFGMLSPQEWQNPPHQYLGSWCLEADQSWTPINFDSGGFNTTDRYEGLNYLKEMFEITCIKACVLKSS